MQLLVADAAVAPLHLPHGHNLVPSVLVQSQQPTQRRTTAQPSHLLPGWWSIDAMNAVHNRQLEAGGRCAAGIPAPVRRPSGEPWQGFHCCRPWCCSKHCRRQQASHYHPRQPCRLPGGCRGCTPRRCCCPPRRRHWRPTGFHARAPTPSYTPPDSYAGKTCITQPHLHNFNFWPSVAFIMGVVHEACCPLIAQPIHTEVVDGLHAANQLAATCCLNAVRRCVMRRSSMVRTCMEQAEGHAWIELRLHSTISGPGLVLAHVPMCECRIRRQLKHPPD